MCESGPSRATQLGVELFEPRCLIPSPLCFCRAKETCEGGMKERSGKAERGERGLPDASPGTTAGTLGGQANDINVSFPQYIHPADAVKLGQAELVVIDEAAAIPLPLVKSLLGPYLVFMASTING